MQEIEPTQRISRRMRATRVRYSLRTAGVLALLVAVVFVVAVPARAAFPGANGLIAFNWIANGNYEIFSVTADGGDKKNLTNNAADDANPAWSPDGHGLAFVSNREGSYALYTMAEDGSSVTHVADNAGWPTWSPTGEQIVIVRSFGAAGTGLVVVNVNGSGETQITSGFTDLTPAWSPDGSEIAFARFLPSGDEAIFAIRPDGTGLRQVTGAPGARDEAPNWSPDGSNIVFSRFGPGGVRSVRQVQGDGSGEHELFSFMSSGGMAVYSPDATRLAFSDGSVLYVSDTSGGNALQVTAGDKPDWQPIGMDCSSGGLLGPTLLNSDAEESGPLSSQIHGSVEPALAPLPPARAAVHEVNCDVVVTIEGLVSG